VCRPLVVALPIDVGLVGESAGKYFRNLRRARAAPGVTVRGAVIGMGRLWRLVRVRMGGLGCSVENDLRRRATEKQTVCQFVSRSRAEPSMHSGEAIGRDMPPIASRPSARSIFSNCGLAQSRHEPHHTFTRNHGHETGQVHQA
jgi:hypothetical protein